jgi:glutaminyl-tRNA synthetase
MKPDGEVRLMGAYIVKCNEIIKNDDGSIKEIHCTADLETGNGMPVDGRKVKGTIHWLSSKFAKDTDIMLYDFLFDIENTGDIPRAKPMMIISITILLLSLRDVKLRSHLRMPRAAIDSSL